MVQDPGKTLHSGTVKPLNLPEPVRADEDYHGLPIALKWRTTQVIAAIEDTRHLDDEWWRSEPPAPYIFQSCWPRGKGH